MKYDYDFTDICITQKEYASTTTEYLETTTTISCYKPFDIYKIYLIDFLFFGIICVIIVIGIKKIFKI